MEDPELVIEKIWQMFDSKDYDEVMDILDDYGSKEWQVGKAWVQLAALKMSNGKLERLRDYMELAREDYRDLWFVAREPNRFRVGMSPEFPESAEAIAIVEQKDKEQYDSWLKGSEVKVCENCSGVGIVPESGLVKDPTFPSGLKLPTWTKCTFCDGTGNQHSD